VIAIPVSAISLTQDEAVLRLAGLEGEVASVFDFNLTAEQAYALELALCSLRPSDSIITMDSLRRRADAQDLAQLILGRGHERRSRD
jgi:hypothetical protein